MTRAVSVLVIVASLLVDETKKDQTSPDQSKPARIRPGKTKPSQNEPAISISKKSVADRIVMVKMLMVMAGLKIFERAKSIDERHVQAQQSIQTEGTFNSLDASFFVFFFFLSQSSSTEKVVFSPIEIQIPIFQSSSFPVLKTSIIVITVSRLRGLVFQGERIECDKFPECVLLVKSLADRRLPFRTVDPSTSACKAIPVLVFESLFS